MLLDAPNCTIITFQRCHSPLIFKAASPKDFRDMILGLGDHSILTSQLCARLEELDYKFLAQVKRPIAASSLLNDWLDSAALSLEDPLATEWNRFTTALKGTGSPSLINLIVCFGLGVMLRAPSQSKIFIMPSCNR